VDFYNTLSNKKVFCCDHEHNYYLLLFAAIDPQNKAVLASAFVHSPQPKSLTVPGLKGPQHEFYEIFIAEDKTVKINGYYDVKRTEDPAVKATSNFVTTVLSQMGKPNAIQQIERRTVLALIRESSASSPLAPEPTPFKHSVSFGAVSFAASRADLTGHHTLYDADPIGHLQAAVDATATQLRDRQAFVAIDESALIDFFTEREQQQKSLPKLKPEVVNRILAPAPSQPLVAAGAADGTCNEFIDQVNQIAKKTLATEECVHVVSDQSACVKAMTTLIDMTFKSFKPSTACTQAAARDIAATFEMAIQPELTKVTGTNSLTNQPRQRLGFGLATGFIGGISSDRAHPRANIQSGKIATDPFVRSIAMGLVNLPLWG
jgi:hypothetical protein